MSTKKLKIAIIADPEFPIPPLLYGGIERIIAMLIKGYSNLGHNICLFAHRDSETPAKLFPYKGMSSSNKKDIILNSIIINKELFSENYDVVHSFGRLAYLLPQLPTKLPKLMSYQREPSVGQIKRAFKLARKNSLSFTGCSNYINNKILPYAPSYAIYNGVDLNMYHFKAIASEHAPLVFLGRIEPIKGTHIAIEIAKRTGKKLVIAGNVSPSYQDYFNKDVKPYLNEQISYIGPIDDKQKNELLGNAACLLMPIEWNEPFGIVMAEAMACGTPIIGFNRGSVPEVIINGLNGYTCNTINEMVDLIAKIPQLDRRKVRQDCEKRFSAEVIINQYLNLYRELIAVHN
ncbi:glycosyltransferase family 4 protein [Pedobacter frigiditerrae]|uniref:glycosyltransferase family 4 protein n=1 Tax=Pedobacter frigiditerrae TaxID=2530452 RepID=UPI00292F67F5|nr:glycosyltransferase family 4 protein [Pedobacter frigiditerrae]